LDAFISMSFFLICLSIFYFIPTGIVILWAPSKLGAGLCSILFLTEIVVGVVSSSLLTEEPCQCSDCQRFYKEHDRLIREFPTFKQQQELNWASIQSFRTLCTKITDELQRELSEKESIEDISLEEKHISDKEITEALDELESVNAYFYSIEALMERIFDTKISKNIESKFQEIANELAPDPLNMDRLILNRLFHQTPDSPDKKNIN